MLWHQIPKIFPGLLNICAKFEEIPSTSKDAIGRQTCGASGPFRENSSHMQTSVPHGTLNNDMLTITGLIWMRSSRGNETHTDTTIKKSVTEELYQFHHHHHHVVSLLSCMDPHMLEFIKDLKRDFFFNTNVSSLIFN